MTPANNHSQNAQLSQCDQNQRIVLIKSALNHIPPLHDPITTRIQRIVFHFIGGKTGFEILQSWFAQSNLFDQGAAYRAWDWMIEASEADPNHSSKDIEGYGWGWRSFPLGWLTPETIFHEAKKHGWSPDDADDEKHAKLLRETRLQARLERVRQLAESRVGWLQTDIDNFMRRKPSFMHQDLTALDLKPWNRELKFLGLDPASGNTIFPLGDGANWFAALSINSLKTEWLKYSIMQNQAHWHPLGTPLPNGKIIITDGLFNGLAIYKSTGIPTAVGVGAKNIGLVAREIRLNFSRNEITLCPDRKVSGAKSKYFAQIDKAAEEIDAFVAYPWDSNKETYRTFFEVFISRGSDGVKDNIELAKHGFPQASICNREVRHG